VHHGTIMPLIRCSAPSNALTAAIRPDASAILVNLCSVHTSPAAYTSGFALRELVIHLDTAIRLTAHAGSLEVESLRVRYAAGTQQDLIDRHPAFRAYKFRIDAFLAVLPSSARYPRVEPCIDPCARQRTDVTRQISVLVV
jgi:hypothetical protein